MNKQYNPEEIESKWRQVWEETKLYQAADNAKTSKAYVLDFFPYPSGAGLSVGHVRNYTISDVPSRFLRMQGQNVLHPMGWDAFGLPAENYAIKNKLSPRVATDQNKATYRRQMQLMGFSYDWQREIDSTDPSYYRWTQWFFLMLYRRGLAYKAEAEVNWCPQDKTVLANEQVVTKNGQNVCERCGHVVEKRRLNQWFFKITEYADRLLDDLNSLNWPEGIKQQQRNWIGRSQGAKLKFKVDGAKSEIEVFTTRIDTIFGATFMVLAPEHPLVQELTTPDQKAEVEAYVKQAQRETEIERQNTERTKTGVFTGAYAINPATNEKIPVWTSDYVLMGYGTGAIMAVPAHDERDFEFAQKFELPIKEVIAPEFGTPLKDAVDVRGPVVIGYDPVTKQFMSLINTKNNMRWFASGGLEEGESFEQAARRELREEAGFEAKELIQLGGPTYSYFYNPNKDSNRRSFSYIFLAIIDSTKPGQQALESHEQYKVVWSNLDSIKADLLKEADGRGHWIDGLERAKLAAAQYDKGEKYTGQVFTGNGGLFNSGKYDGLTSADAKAQLVKDLPGAEATVNYRMRDWLISRQRYWGAPIPIVYCDKDGIVPVHEDQLPVLLPEVESYEPTGDARSPLAGIEEFVKTTCPQCGGPAERETDTMDGFACSSWYFLRFADPHNQKAAFDRSKADYWLPVDLYIGGAEHAVMHLLYARFWTKVMQDEGLIDFGEPFLELRNQGMILAQDGRKMSKSLGNVITPDEVIEQGYGADALRLYEMFIAPFDQAVAWNQRGLDGTQRFIKRVWALVYEFSQAQDSVQNAELETAMLAVTHRTIKRVTDDIGSFGFNTAVAALMELVNELYKLKADLPPAGDTWALVLRTLVQLLAPLAPFVSEELWQELGGQGSVHVSTWPKYEEKYIKEELIEVPVQVNGKLRGTVVIDPAISEDELKRLAAELEGVQRHLEGKTIAKTIVVPRKLVNFVVK